MMVDMEILDMADLDMLDSVMDLVFYTDHVADQDVAKLKSDAVNQNVNQDVVDQDVVNFNKINSYNLLYFI